MSAKTAYTQEFIKGRIAVVTEEALATKDALNVCPSHKATVEASVTALQLGEMQLDIQTDTNNKIDFLIEQHHLSNRIYKGVMAVAGSGGIAAIIIAVMKIVEAVKG